MEKYEAVIVYKSSLDEAQLGAELEKVSALVSAREGKVEFTDNWGKRPLAYEIENETYGQYVLLILTGDNKLVAELNRALKINDAVLRHIVVLKDKHAPDGRPKDTGRKEREDHRGGRRDRTPRPAAPAETAPAAEVAASETPKAETSVEESSAA